MSGESKVSKDVVMGNPMRAYKKVVDMKPILCVEIDLEVVQDYAAFHGNDNADDELVLLFRRTLRESRTWR